MVRACRESDGARALFQFVSRDSNFNTSLLHAMRFEGHIEIFNECWRQQGTRPHYILRDGGRA